MWLMLFFFLGIVCGAAAVAGLWNV